MKSGYELKGQFNMGQQLGRVVSEITVQIIRGMWISEGQIIRGYTVHDKTSQNEKKMRQYMSLKYVIQNNFCLVLRAFGCVPLLRDHLSCKTTFLWQKGWSQMTGFTVINLSNIVGILRGKWRIPCFAFAQCEWTLSISLVRSNYGPVTNSMGIWYQEIH